MEQDTAAANTNVCPRVPLTIAVVAIVVGSVLRIIEFSRDRPLWLDEAMLALNVASRSFGRLARPLDYDQSAPLLYLWLERVAVSLGGVSEPSLRVVPFLAGIGLLPLAWIVARRLAATTTAALTTVLVAVSVTLMTFGAEAKQYGVDPLATVVLVLLAARAATSPNETQRWTQFGAGAVGCLLLSQPAVFVLAGALVALAADRGVRGARRAVWRLLVVAAVSGGVFLALYSGFYRATAQSAYMRHFWEGTFLDPRAPDLLLRLRLFESAAFVAPALAARGVGFAGALGIAWLAGVVTLWHRNRFGALVVAMPVTLAAVATSLGFYAVMDRLFLFAAPLTLIAYASLVARVVELAPARSSGIALAGASAGLALIVAPAHATRISHPVFYAVGRDVVADVDSMARGEPVYVAARSFPLWVYYTTDWNAPDRGRLRWAASIAGAGSGAHNNAPSRGAIRASDSTGLSRRYRGRVEVVGLPTGRQYLTSTRTLNPTLPPTDYAVPLTVDRGWSGMEVDRMAAVARPRIWIFGSHMFALDGAEPGLVAELQRRNVRLVMERRQGSTVAYHVEFPGEP